MKNKCTCFNSGINCFSGACNICNKPKINKTMTKELTIQQVVDYLGNNIIDKKLSGSITKGIGEVKINETMYQIQLSLEPEGGKWIDGNEIFTFKKLSWLQKIIKKLKYEK